MIYERGKMKLETLKKLERGEQVTIVFLGDSNTELTFHTHGFLNVAGLVQAGLFERYGSNRAFVINSGRCGESADMALDRLERDVLRFAPDLVFVGYGMNDGTNGAGRLDVYLKAMREIVRRLRAAGAEVVLRTTNPVVCVNGPDNNSDRVPGHEFPHPAWAHALYSEALVRLGKELDCPVVDHYLSWKAPGVYPEPTFAMNNPNSLWLRMSDMIHPSEIGHRAFYRELAPLLDLPLKFSWEY